MSAFSELLGSSASLIVLCMGVTAVLGLLHLWISDRLGDASSWVAAWCGLSCVFLGARGIQITTPEPQVALTAGKVALSIGPYLVWAIVGFGRSANGRDPDPRMTRRLGGVSVAWTVAIVLTPWFVDSKVSTRTDFWGQEHLAVSALWPTAVLGVYFIGALVWGVRRLRRGGSLEAGERRALMLGFALYAVLGAGAVLTSIGVISIPAMAEFGPFVISLSLCHLMVRRRQRVERQLGELLAEKQTRLAESEERFQDLLRSVPVGVVLCDPSGAATSVNPAMSQLIARSGRVVAEEGARESAHLAQLGLASAVDSVVSTGAAVRQEIRVPSPAEGTGQVWQVTASPFVDAVGGGVLVLVDDLTERSHLQAKLQQSQKMDAIGQLAAGVAHEINNPMAYVRANLGMMRDLHAELGLQSVAASGGQVVKNEEVVGELQMLLEESLEGVERTIEIVRDMHELARPGEEEDPRCDLAQVIDSCLRIAVASNRQGGEIERAVSETADVALAGGPLRQVVLNLLVNGLQAAGEGGRVRISTDRIGDAIRVFVDDDGPGVTESLRGRLFDPFFTTKAEGEGTGLGLYVSYRILRRFDGEIRVSDGPLGGARFTLTLPLA